MKLVEMETFIVSKKLKSGIRDYSTRESLLPASVLFGNKIQLRKYEAQQEDQVCKFLQIYSLCDSMGNISLYFLCVSESLCLVS